MIISRILIYTLKYLTHNQWKSGFLLVTMAQSRGVLLSYASFLLFLAGRAVADDDLQLEHLSVVIIHTCTQRCVSGMKFFFPYLHNKSRPFFRYSDTATARPSSIPSASPTIPT